MREGGPAAAREGGWGGGMGGRKVLKGRKWPWLRQPSITFLNDLKRCLGRHSTDSMNTYSPCCDVVGRLGELGLSAAVEDRGRRERLTSVPHKVDAAERPGPSESHVESAIDGPD